MRTSVTLDDETYELTSTYAAARQITLGAAIGELVRAQQPADKFPNIEMGPNGIPILSSKGGPITMELVKSVLDDES